MKKCKCGNTEDKVRFRPKTNQCVSCYNTYLREYRLKHPRKQNKEKRRLDRIRDVNARHAYDRKWRINLRLAAMDHYGGRVCCRCGERRIGCLTIDHINQCGAKHRQQIGLPTGSIFRWLANNNYPAGFRVLCSNCNHLTFYEHCLDRQLSSNRSAISKMKRAREQKREIITLLGSNCQCGVDDIRLLTVHHINGDGAEHRRRICNGRGSAKFYAAVLSSGDLTGLECRCFNCNDLEEWKIEEAECT